MAARVTVVFDDERLYRDLKVKAAENGVALKKLIEAALRDYLDREQREWPKFDWEKFLEHRRRAEKLDEELGPGPTDLSDIKHHLYGWPKGGLVAEERARYDERTSQ